MRLAIGAVKQLMHKAIDYIQATMTIYRISLIPQVIMMTAVLLSTCTKVRSLVSINAFHYPSSLTVSTMRWGSSAAYGRTTFRHPPGDMSWRMTSSPDDEVDETPPLPTTTTQAEQPNLEMYQNKNNLDDQVFSAISADGGLKVTVATMRNLLNEFMIQHSMNPIPGGKYSV